MTKTGPGRGQGRVPVGLGSETRSFPREVSEDRGRPIPVPGLVPGVSGCGGGDWREGDRGRKDPRADPRGDGS